MGKSIGFEVYAEDPVGGGFPASESADLEGSRLDENRIGRQQLACGR